MQNKNTIPSKYLWVDTYVILTDQQCEFHIVKTENILNDNNLIIYQIPSINNAIYSKLNKLISSYLKKNASFTIEFSEYKYQWQISFFEEKSNEQYAKELKIFYKNFKR